jgi:hypothetical protein
MYIFLCVCVCIHKTCKYVYVCICMYVCMYVCIYVCTLTLANLCTKSEGFGCTRSKWSFSRIAFSMSTMSCLLMYVCMYVCMHILPHTLVMTIGYVLIAYARPVVFIMRLKGTTASRMIRVGYVILTGIQSFRDFGLIIMRLKGITASRMIRVRSFDRDSEFS